MGLFSSSRNPYFEIEKKLEKEYISILQTRGMSLPMAQEIFQGLLKIAQKESQKETPSSQIENFGDYLLMKEALGGEIKLVLERKRNDGVKDEDIKWWWNMYELEREMMLATDNWMIATFIGIQTKNMGLTIEEAVALSKKYHPSYCYWATDYNNPINDDDPLPIELKDRVNIYIQKRNAIDPEDFKMELAESPTINSLIRKEIKAGNI